MFWSFGKSDSVVGKTFSLSHHASSVSVSHLVGLAPGTMDLHSQDTGSRRFLLTVICSRSLEAFVLDHVIAMLPNHAVPFAKLLEFSQEHQLLIPASPICHCRI